MKMRKITVARASGAGLRPNFKTRKIVGKLKSGYLLSKRKPKEGGESSSTKETMMVFGMGQQFMPGFPGAPGTGVPEEEVAKESPGIAVEVSKIPSPLTAPLSSEEKEMLRGMDEKYPLIPENPGRNEKIYAYARIKWDPTKNELVYFVVEPQLSEREDRMVEYVKKELEERLDIDFMKLGEIRAKELLDKEIRHIISGIKGLDSEKIDVINYYVQRNIIGLDRIEPLMKDKSIEDISCDGEKTPIFIYHRNPLYGSMRSNIIFEDMDELDTFVMRLSQKCGKSISVAEPMAEGSLPDGSRVHATLGTDIARRGSNFTIRKFTKSPLTPVHMLAHGTLDSTQLAYLWIAIENRKSMLISGGTASGKTSLLNALSLFIRPNMKIVSIEDTPEISLPHPHWVPEVARTPISEGRKAGEISLFDLLKSSLRQRPDYIIVGEVRGVEAYVLFQQIATGHSGIATIHAATLPQLMDRLTTPPINLPPSLIENLDIIIFLMQVKSRDRNVRRVNQILEVVGVKGDKPVTSEIFRWKPVEDKFETPEKSQVLDHIAKSLGLNEATLKEEIRTRKQILEWMYEKRMFDYVEVSNIINSYYSNPERIVSLIEENV